MSTEMRRRGAVRRECLLCRSVFQTSIQCLDAAQVGEDHSSAHLLCRLWESWQHQGRNWSNTVNMLKRRCKVLPHQLIGLLRQCKLWQRDFRRCSSKPSQPGPQLCCISQQPPIASFVHSMHVATDPCLLRPIKKASGTVQCLSRLL